MKKFLFCLFLFSTFATVGQAQTVTEAKQSDNVSAQEETTISSDTSQKLNAEELDSELRKELTLRLFRRYKSMSLKDLEKRKKYVEKQIKRKADSKNEDLKEKLDIELDVINTLIEQAKNPTTQKKN